MIIKLFELRKNKKIKTSLNLIYGNNIGQKKQIINDYFTSDFEGKVINYDEDYIINNTNDFISNILNQSLFEKEKILIINRATDKILKIILDIMEKDVKEIKIILESGILEKKSKIRSLFEKDKNLTCIPVYEDDNKSLGFIVQDFLKKNNIKFSQEIINVLIDRAKGDREYLKNELLKLESLLITKKNIDIEDIKKLTNLADNYSVFELTDNYLAKNLKKVSHILNENNYNSEDCILILRTILNKSKRLLKLKNQLNKNKNLDSVLSSFRPPIFWKEKEIVKKQMQSRSDDEVKKIIYKINDLERIVKKNSTNSLNFVSDFVLNF
tara:strand:- start:324 stop:1301 length:978 start_codon:yes stop_codon:yes gene_type:complete